MFVPSYAQVVLSRFASNEILTPLIPIKKIVLIE
jgi:hypothetical protein